METKNSGRIAIVFGATGLVGRYLVEELIEDPETEQVVLFGRRRLENDHPKVIQHLTDFSDLVHDAVGFRGDELYICLGTTIRKAGSVKRMEEIDRDLPVRIANLAAANGIRSLAVVSSMGADPDSRNYYMRIKGQMEEGIRRLNLEQTVIARPSILFGNRREFRFGELIGRGFMHLIGWFMMGPAAKYRGIHGRTVARAMIRLLRSPHRKLIYLSDELQVIGKA